MTFAVFVPEHEPSEKLPVLFYLSGLTCTHANVMEKGEYRRACADERIIFVAPDTSPRGPDMDGQPVPDDPDGAYDFGLGAGFLCRCVGRALFQALPDAQLYRERAAGADRRAISCRHVGARHHRP